MVQVRASPILQLIRRTVEDLHVRELPDQDVLQRFHSQHDQAAFQTLLRRHGPMVWEVCCGVLGNEADAEDAFQATFFILARKPNSIRETASLASWLHGVAYRTALKARAQAATRHKHEARVPAPQTAEPDDLSWREVRQVLHEEVSGLPERYRAPLVLCYLEGATQEAAALQLKLAKSTLREHLERGLKGVLGVGLVTEHAAAYLQHHRPVAAQQSMESRLVLLGMEPLEQVLVRQFAHLHVLNRAADQLQDGAGSDLDHRSAPFGRKPVLALHNSSLRQGEVPAFFQGNAHVA